MHHKLLTILGIMTLVFSCSQGVPHTDATLLEDQTIDTPTPDLDSSGPLVCTPPAAIKDPAWYHTAVGYEVFVRSFRDSDGDGIGDFAGLLEKLDYLNDGVPGEGDDLEVDLIWLMPIHPSPSYHGYDVIDYRDVHGDYGGMEGFEAFLAAAHARGVKVIIDLVVNHSSKQHPWFQASAAGEGHEDWYVWSDTPKDWKRPWGGGATWHKHGDRWYYGVFWGGMPDLNCAGADLTAEMHDIGRYWLEKGVDGFRLDAVRYLVETGPSDGQQDVPETLAWWRDFAAAMRKLRPDALLVGEAWTSNAIAALYHGDGDSLQMTFDFDLSAALLGAVKGSDGVDIENVLCRFGDLFPTGAADGVFLTNHDMVRAASKLGEEDDASRLAAGLLFAMPGTPWIYYGEEIGMRNGTSLGDEAKRKPMQWAAAADGGFTEGAPWEPLHPETATINVAAQTEDPDSLLSLYRALIRARRSSAALLRGGAAAAEVRSPTSAEVWGLLRSTDNEEVLCTFNLGETGALAVSATTDGAATSAEDLLSGEVVPVVDGQVQVGDLGPRNFRYLRLISSGERP